MSEPRTKHILVVDDDRAIRDAISDVLEAEGYRVTLAENGQKGLEFLNSTDQLPNLIFLDLSMPVKDGVAFCEEQVANERLSSIPVVIMSAESFVEKRCSGTRAVKILRKPLDIDILTAAAAKYSN